jgi:hypothetical protein
MAQYFDFEKTILGARENAERRNLQTAIQMVKNKQFQQDMALRKSQLNERIRTNKALEDYRDIALAQADRQFGEQLTEKKRSSMELETDRDADRTQRTVENQKDRVWKSDEADKQRVWSSEEKTKDRMHDRGQLQRQLSQRRYEFKKKHKLNEKQFKAMVELNDKKHNLSVAEFNLAKDNFEAKYKLSYDSLAQDMIKFQAGMNQDLYKFNEIQGFKEYAYQDAKRRSMVDPGLMPSTALPQVDDSSGMRGFVGDLAYIGSGAGVGAGLGSAFAGVGAIPGAIIGGGTAILDIIAGGSPSSTMKSRKTAPQLNQAEAWIGEVESIAPYIGENPMNQAALSTQLVQLQNQLADIKQTKRVKLLSKRIADLENQVVIPGTFNLKQSLAK